MSASVAVYRNIYTEDRFKQAYGNEDKPRGGVRLRERLAGSCRCSQGACLHLLRERVPIFNWLPKYRLKKCILGDTIAGMTVGILHIPQGWYKSVNRTKCGRQNTRIPETNVNSLLKLTVSCSNFLLTRRLDNLMLFRIVWGALTVIFDSTKACMTAYRCTLWIRLNVGNLKTV